MKIIKKCRLIRKLRQSNLHLRNANNSLLKDIDTKNRIIDNLPSHYDLMSAREDLDFYKECWFNHQNELTDLKDKHIKLLAALKIKGVDITLDK
jgi:hypothetical protein